MPAPARVSKPARSLTEERKRAQRIFARLMAGQSMRAIATSENLSLRRVQQIVREQLDRRNANPADDFALLQIARLERALDLIGGQRGAALRRAETAAKTLRANAAKRNRPQALDNTENRETADSAPAMISEA